MRTPIVHRRKEASPSTLAQTTDTTNKPLVTKASQAGDQNTHPCVIESKYIHHAIKPHNADQTAN